MRRVSLTDKQHRTLGRIVRGERLALSRFRVETSTFSSLLRKLLVGAREGAWFATARGREVYATHGRAPASESK